MHGQPHIRFTSAFMFATRRNRDDSKHISANAMYCVLLETSVGHCGFRLCDARKLNVLEHNVHKIGILSTNRPTRNMGVVVHVKGTEDTLNRLSFLTIRRNCKPN
jgi:hypothetical protein